jgi:hypothetical protein
VSRRFVLALLALGVVVSVTVVPGVFTIDDDNYMINVLALRHGHLTIANTEGLSASRELLAFDPGPWTRAVDSTPVASTAPPLYAVLALPFSWLGWRGLVALNTLAYLVTIALVFLYTREYAADASTAWMAAAAFALGGWAIEYAQGVWPHALSIALCTGGIVAAGRLVDDGRLSLAAAAGFLLALASGVRYQNAIVLVTVCGAVAWWAPRRLAAITAFSLGAAIPLSVGAFINHVRLGSWNPISKGRGYLRVPQLAGSARSLFDPVVMFWARLVDFSVRPPLVGPGFGWVVYDPATGAHLMLGRTLEKAFLQSAPWAILALALFVLAWAPRFRMPDARRRQVRLLSLVTAAVLVAFACSGVRRHEGLSFNQRYLLELLPLAAMASAWALDGIAARAQPLLIATLSGLLLVVLVLFDVPIGGHLQQRLIFELPLLLSLGLALLWFLRSRSTIQPLILAMAGVCVGWGLGLHLLDDVPASRRLRGANLMETNALAGVVTDGSALVAYSGGKDAVFPLLFDRDIVILDARADEGKDAPLLIRQLLDRHRRVFLLESGFPEAVLPTVVQGLQAVPLDGPGAGLVELRVERTERDQTSRP